jgi:hypothetical protein
MLPLESSRRITGKGRASDTVNSSVFMMSDLIDWKFHFYGFLRLFFLINHYTTPYERQIHKVENRTGHPLCLANFGTLMGELVSK